MAASDVAVVAVAKALGDSGQDLYVVGADFWPEGKFDVSKVLALGGPWVAELPNLEALAQVLKAAKTVFTSPLASGVFATSEDLTDGEFTRIVAKPSAPTSDEDARIAKAMSTMRLCKTDEERFVLGIVLEPDVVDSQTDFYSAEDVRKAAHRFMEEYEQLGTQHQEIVTGKLRVLESYVAPSDFEVGDQKVKKGSWVLAIRAVDDELWSQIKKGSFTGFSIGGFANRRPEPAPAGASQ